MGDSRVPLRLLGSVSFPSSHRVARKKTRQRSPATNAESSGRLTPCHSIISSEPKTGTKTSTISTHCNKGCIFFFQKQHIIGSHPRTHTHTRAATVVHRHTPPCARVMKRSFCASDMNPNSVLGAYEKPSSHPYTMLCYSCYSTPPPHTAALRSSHPALSPRPTASGINALKYHRRLKMLLQ